MNNLHTLTSQLRYSQYPDLTEASIANGERIGRLLDQWSENTVPFGLWQDDASDNGPIFVIKCPEHTYMAQREDTAEHLAQIKDGRHSLLNNYNDNTWYVDQTHIVHPMDRSTENITAMAELTPAELETISLNIAGHEHEWEENGYCRCDHYNQDYDQNLQPDGPDEEDYPG